MQEFFIDNAKWKYVTGKRKTPYNLTLFDDLHVATEYMSEKRCCSTQALASKFVAEKLTKERRNARSK